MTRLTANQVVVMASVLGVSNAGSDHLFEGPRAEWTPESLRKSMTRGRFRIDVDSVTTLLVSGLCENQSMLDMFLEEADSWVSKLKRMDVDKVKATWPRYAGFVEVVQ